MAATCDRRGAFCTEGGCPICCRAPWGMPAAEGCLGQKARIHRFWGPHKNRAPLFVPRSAALVNASMMS